MDLIDFVNAGAERNNERRQRLALAVRNALRNEHPEITNVVIEDDDAYTVLVEFEGMSLAIEIQEA